VNDPGPWQWMACEEPPLGAQRRLRAMLDFGANPQLRHLLSYASRVALPHTVQDSLPAGWLAFAGWESNPLERCERFQFVLTIILSFKQYVARGDLPPDWGGDARNLTGE
jgi:hypothetical protein